MDAFIKGKALRLYSSAAVFREQMNLLILKKACMKTNFIQQELLLFTNSSFAKRELAGKDNQQLGTLFQSAREQLKAGCWNGLMAELLPEIMEKSANGKPLFLWDLYEGNSFIGLYFGEQMERPEACSSIDPHSFLAFTFES